MTEFDAVIEEFDSWISDDNDMRSEWGIRKIWIDVLISCGEDMLGRELTIEEITEIKLRYY